MKTIQNSILSFDSLGPPRGVVSFSTTRLDGYSKGTFESFNLSYYSGDDPLCVDLNREKLCRFLQTSPQYLFVPYQTHGTGIAVLEKDFLSLPENEQQSALYGKDALVTAARQVYIGVTTADCVPILVFAQDKKVIAAVHAGWRGCCKRILQQTISLLIRDFGCKPEAIRIAMGPSICKDSFEVGDEVYEAFRLNGFKMDTLASKHPESGKYHIDLWEANRQQALEKGIPDNQMEIAGICTFQQTDLFFSARKEGIVSGRMLTGIGLI